MTASSTAAWTKTAWSAGTEFSPAFSRQAGISAGAAVPRGGTPGGVPAARSLPFPAALPESLSLRLAGKVEESIVDGPGLRYVLFTQGCPHLCPGCHNPGTHDFRGGTPVSLPEILKDIRKNPITRGVTFSGGEPFSQSEALAPLAAALKREGYHLMAYTGYLFEDLLRQPRHAALLHCLDLLVDGPFVLEQRSLDLRFRGSANQRCIDLPLSLLHGHVVLREL